VITSRRAFGRICCINFHITGGGARLDSQTWHYIHGGPKKRSSLRVDNFATVRVGRRVICQVYKFCLEKVQN